MSYFCRGINLSMPGLMKKLIKRIFSILHISVTRNQRYDAYTRRIIRRTLKPGSNCIDIGCHKGEILDLMIKGAPQGRQIGFEPIPELYRYLVKKYSGNTRVTIYPVALYDKTGTTTFQHVLSDPAYSGIKKRSYEGKSVEIDQITVQTDELDRCIPPDLRIDLMKIDVEGAEFRVMKGGVQTIRRCRPVIIFEFGLGAADFYNSAPGELFGFLTGECGLKISTLKGFLENVPELPSDLFCEMFRKGSEYYFVAHP